MTEQVKQQVTWWELWGGLKIAAGRLLVMWLLVKVMFIVIHWKL